MPLNFLLRTKLSPVVLGLLVIGVQLTVALVTFFADEGRLVQGALQTQLRVIGTLLMMAILPGYLLGAMVWLMRHTLATLEQIRAIAAPTALNRVTQRIERVAWYNLGLVPLGLAYGFSQNNQMIGAILSGAAFTALDVTFILGNALLWAVVGLLLGWRLPVMLALREVAGSLRVDIYTPRQVQPLTRLATRDVLIIAGAMVLMPLQSLDAEFRWYNYNAGIVVGLTAAAAFFFFPLSGLRASITAAKVERVQELERQLAAINRQDVVALETVSAHIDRVRHVSSWGLDVALLVRVLSYVVIPPLAWVGAALVENLVDSF